MATSGDLDLATSGDFYMATDTAERQPYLPDSELGTSHAGAGNEDKGRRLVRSGAHPS